MGRFYKRISDDLRFFAAELEIELEFFATIRMTRLVPCIFLLSLGSVNPGFLEAKQ